MLLLWIVFDLLNFASSYTTKSVCYGSSFDVIPPFFITSLYYEPRGGERTLAVSPQGKSNHKRFSVTYGSIKMKDVTEEDHGAMLFFDQSGRAGVRLEIHECQDRHYSLYGDEFSWEVPSGAEYLEFSQKSFPIRFHKPRVIWNRTDASSGWGAVKHNTFQLHNLKQKHSGYYKFMGAKGELIEWKRIEVEDQLHTFKSVEGDNFDFPVKFPVTHVHFHPLHGGSVFEVINQDHHDRRSELTSDRFHIRGLKPKDSGTYDFIDDEGFQVVQVYLIVKTVSPPPWAYIVIILVFIVHCIGLCYICVKKYSCKKINNRNRSETTAAASCHDTSRRSQPVMSLLSIDPRVMTSDPPTYDQAVGNMDLPPSTQVPGGWGPTSTKTYDHINQLPLRP